MAVDDETMQTDDPRYCECRVYYQYDCGALVAANQEIARLRDENDALREANEGLDRLTGFAVYSTDELLNELELRGAPYRATQTEADLVRTVGRLRAALTTIRDEAMTTIGDKSIPLYGAVDNIADLADAALKGKV